ncbi:hypothetical protein [Algoriphagus chordae]|uniref:Uncharacterized protein n=1 Tax=Algoriphagus chordae TaxID=237019 RepID=A0A2W7RGP8_9BACT|nr:hypothetical protein [Algoriphagus chordae]PZX49905.1 hypothetical protein LV85_02968 [Algoriphagus chordae]
MKSKPWPTLEEWIQSDETLLDKLAEIEQSELSVEEQAREALDFLCKTYHLPKTSLDVENRDWEDAGDSFYLPISMFEQIAQLLFVEPENNDPRYLVINSAYLIKHKLVIDMSQELSEYLGDDELQGLGYRGEDILTAELVPVRKGESWSELGCRFFIKEVG